MKKLAIIATAVLVSVSSVGFAASEKSLDKNQTTQMFQDKTVTTEPLVTLDKQLVNNKITAFFDKTGQVTGQFATKPDNTVQNDQGTWIVKPNGALCVTWQQWNNKQPICVFVYSLKDTVIFINADTNNFESVFQKSNIKSGNQVNNTTTTTTMN